MEGILAQPRFVLGPAVDAEGHFRGNSRGRSRGCLRRALVWAAVAHGRRDRETVVSKLGTVDGAGTSVGIVALAWTGGGGGDWIASLMRPRRVWRSGAGAGGAAAAIQGRRGKDRGSVAVFGYVDDNDQTSDGYIRRSRGSTSDRRTEPFVSVLRIQSCAFDEQRRARAGSRDRGRSRDRV